MNPRSFKNGRAQMVFLRSTFLGKLYQVGFSEVLAAVAKNRCFGWGPSGDDDQMRLVTIAGYY